MKMGERKAFPFFYLVKAKAKPLAMLCPDLKVGVIKLHGIHDEIFSVFVTSYFFTTKALKAQRKHWYFRSSRLFLFCALCALVGFLLQQHSSSK